MRFREYKTKFSMCIYLYNIIATIITDETKRWQRTCGGKEKKGKSFKNAQVLDIRVVVVVVKVLVRVQLPE